MPDDYNICGVCGFKFSAVELSGEDKLRKDLYDSRATIQNLNETITELKRNINNPEENQQIINDYESKLAKAEAEKIRFTKKEKKNLTHRFVDWIIFLMVCIVLGTCAYHIYNELKIVSSERNDSQTNKMDLNSRLKNIKTEKIKTDELLDAISKTTFQTGYDITNHISDFDNDNIMWLKADLPLIITNIKVKSKESGTTVISLCNEQDSIINSQAINVTGNIQQVPLNFEIPQKGDYYLMIEGIDLGYFSTTGGYNFINDGFLTILGYWDNGDNKLLNKTKQTYYQYFYNIEYKIILTNQENTNIDFDKLFDNRIIIPKSEKPVTINYDIWVLLIGCIMIVWVLFLIVRWRFWEKNNYTNNKNNKSYKDECEKLKKKLLSLETNYMNQKRNEEKILKEKNKLERINYELVKQKEKEVNAVIAENEKNDNSSATILYADAIFDGKFKQVTVQANDDTIFKLYLEKAGADIAEFTIYKDAKRRVLENINLIDGCEKSEIIQNPVDLEVKNTGLAILYDGNWIIIKKAIIKFE